MLCSPLPCAQRSSKARAQVGEKVPHEERAHEQKELLEFPAMTVHRPLWGKWVPHEGLAHEKRELL